MSVPSLFEVCAHRIPEVHTPREVLAQVPEDVVEKLFAPLRSLADKYNMRLRKWLAGAEKPLPLLPLRGRFVVFDTDPASSVGTLANCDELVLERFDVRQLSHAVFKNLTRLTIRYPLEAQTALSVDVITAPLLRVVSLKLRHAINLATLCEFMKTKTARQCTTVRLALSCCAPMYVRAPIEQLPIQRRRSNVERLRLDLYCAESLEMLFLQRIWSATIHTLVMFVSVGAENADSDICFHSVRTLGLLPRFSHAWTPRKAARICAVWFPGVQRMAVDCTVEPTDGVLPSFLRDATDLFFGQRHPLNRGDPDLASLLQ